MAERASGTSSPVAGRYHLDTRSRLTRTERVARGKAARAEVPRDGRRGRMAVSPFTFFRGAACPMASDLAATPVSGLAVQAYLGGSDMFDRAITRFAEAYADQSEHDYRALTDAVASGRIAAENGP